MTEGPELNPDFRDLLTALTAEKVRASGRAKDLEDVRRLEALGDEGA